MREEDSKTWEEELPSLNELMPLSQTLITPHLAIAFDITTTTPDNFQRHLHHRQLPTTPSNPTIHTQHQQQQPSSADSGDFGSGNGADEPARTLKRPRLVWTPQLHKRFVDAVAHLGIKSAVPKTIMQFMSVDGLTRENVASHLQKYRLYLKRMQGLSSGGGGGDAATDHLFASSPVPPHFLQQGRTNSDHFLPFVQVPAIQHHHQMAAVQHHQPQFHRQAGHLGSRPNGHYEHPFLSRQSQQQVHRIGAPMHSPVAGYVEDMGSENASGGRKILTLFPTGD
ncbi:hypothetical protein TanjilG_21839 [Lupinus angustifolius]|uniref:HTH myb-type domain-containing protein n=1 Tax=Lupinus angustifolius TaxID=3871 RepID=A0A1J7GRP3_LUPAN|nr:PREDICTED: transcription factor LUX-like [Lupinus angustifolius]OIW03207.1 hypothetical protein TanjilG_21839 [Lupinus angustifolius]